MSKHIVTMGGGGFSTEPDNPLLDRYLLSLTNKETPKICFIPTASGDQDNYINRFYQAFSRYHCISTHLSLFDMNFANLSEKVLSQKLIYVGGGNTRNMLILWKEWGLDKILYQAWEQGIILAGLSAGSICWFEEGVTDANPNRNFSSIQGLGFLKGSHCPH